MLFPLLPAQLLLSWLGSLGALKGCPELKVVSLSFPSVGPVSTGNSGRAPDLQDGSRKLWECRVNSDQKSPADKVRLRAPYTPQMGLATLHTPQHLLLANPMVSQKVHLLWDVWDQSIQWSQNLS